MLTVYNASSQDWKDVRIFLNDNYRVVTPIIAAHGQFKAPLDVFVEAYDYRTKRANIERHELALDGLVWRSKRVVLDLPVHLSYPRPLRP